MRDDGRVSEIEKMPPAADMRYEDEDAGKVARVLVRVEWADGKVREYEAEDPEGFQINDPERDFTLAPMRMSVQAPGSPVVPMLAATAKVDLSFRVRFQSNPRRALQIRTERTVAMRDGAWPSGGNSGDESQVRQHAGNVIADSGDSEADQFPAPLQRDELA